MQVHLCYSDFISLSCALSGRMGESSASTFAFGRPFHPVLQRGGIVCLTLPGDSPPLFCYSLILDVA